MALLLGLPTAAAGALVLMSAIPFGPLRTAQPMGSRDDLAAVSHVAALLSLPILLLLIG
jgi:hypothetical protein